MVSLMFVCIYLCTLRYCKILSHGPVFLLCYNRITDPHRSDRRRIDRLREAIRNRRLALEEAGSRHREGEEYLDESQLTLTRNRELHARTTASLNTRRKELLADLFSIYPIEQVSAESSQLQIRGCVLPNSVYVGYEEERIATALGYTCHLVCMLAYYLGLPLRYPMRPMGSRAKVTDPVSVVQGSRE